jgi:HAMP domain-containing protein
MAEPTSILSQRWSDILPPLSPPSLTPWLLLSAVVLLVLVVIVVFVLWQQRPRQRALRVLRRCRAQLQTGAMDARVLAQTCYRVLLQGMGLQPASMSRAGVAADPRWQAFYRDLQQCAFASSPPPSAQLASLIEQACYWLRHS